MKPLARRFLRPTNPAHRQCEALCAHFVDNLSLLEAAGCLGYRIGTVRNLPVEEVSAVLIADAEARFTNFGVW